MEFIKTKGLIINKRDIEESDRYITVFTEKVGKIDFFIKGIRKSKKREINSTEILTISNFSFYRKGEKYILGTIDFIEGFQELKSDMDKLQLGYYIVSIINKIVYPEEKRVEFFQRVERALNYIQKNEILNSYFLILKMLKWITDNEGYGLRIKGKKYLNIFNSVISDEKTTESINLTEEIFDIIEGLEGNKKISLNKETLLKTIEIFEKYFNYYFETNIKLSCFRLEVD